MEAHTAEPLPKHKHRQSSRAIQMWLKQALPQKTVLRDEGRVHANARSTERDRTAKQHDFLSFSA